MRVYIYMLYLGNIALHKVTAECIGYIEILVGM